MDRSGVSSERKNCSIRVLKRMLRSHIIRARNVMHANQPYGNNIYDGGAKFKLYIKNNVIYAIVLEMFGYH